jgi:CubicO group peptidase (beta-lactamase class C family)
MKRTAFLTALLLCAGVGSGQTLPGVHEAVAPFLERKEAAGLVTVVVTPEKVVHVEAQGWADVERKAEMKADDVFWIASMTKPVTAVAVLMLADEGKLSVDDPASKYVPELGAMKNADGSPLATPITIKHLMTHTAGLPENAREETRAAKTLQDLVDAFAKKPMSFEPGTKWAYSQTAINSLGRIVEVVSGKRFDDFLDERIFKPLGMADTTFYPSKEQQKRLATSYRVEGGNGGQGAQLMPAEIFIFAGRDLHERDRVPLANGGLFSTAADYGTFVRMLLNDGSLDGKRYLKPETVKQMGSLQTGELKTGFTPGNGWGLGVCVVREPQGVSAALSQGSFGHGGAYGTQAWVDPMKKVGYVLMVQRQNFPNADASDLRKAFQDAAAKALVDGASPPSSGPK